MRNILFIVVFLGLGFFLYKHPALYKMPDNSAASPAPSSDTSASVIANATGDDSASAATPPNNSDRVAKAKFTGDPGGTYALKETYRTAADGPMLTRIVVVNGRYWRTENKLDGSAKKIGVIVNNGVESFTNMDAGYISGYKDPRHELDALVVGASQLRGEFAAYPPGSPEPHDGVTSWKTAADYQGAPVQAWISTTTGFPVAIESSQNGRYIEAHFTPIPIDFKRPETTDYFDPSHTDPMFSKFLP